MRSFVGFLVLCGAMTTPAAAQPGGTTGRGDAWVVVPVEPGGEENPQVTQLSVRLRRALESEGTAILDDTAAGELVEERVSQPVSELSESDITTWASSSQAALRALARADYDNAREALVAAQEVAQRAAEELNREAERAREVLDTCLFTARVFLETHQRTEAERQVRSCRVLVPEVEPRRHRHPPEVHALLERVDAEETNGGLRVTSTPTGCTVRINGVPQGETPFAVEQLARGDYRLQVECSEEERGRVHMVRIDDGTTEVDVDVSFDRALTSRPFPRLISEDDALAHGRRLAAALDRTVLIVAVPSEANAQVFRVEPSGTATHIAMSAIGDAAQAAGFLRAGESMDLRGDEPESMEPPTTEALDLQVPMPAEGATDPGATEATGPGLPKWRLAVGLGATIAGAATFGVAAFLAVEQGSRGANYQAVEPTFVSMDGTDSFRIRQDRWLDARAPFLATTFIAGPLLGAGTALLTPPDSSVPWWSWAAGGVGLALGGVSVALVVSAPDCPAINSAVFEERRDCVDRRQRRATAALVGMAALPFLTIPLSSLLQSGGSDTQLSLSPTRDGARLTLGGRF